jgi:4-hydroxythreonine-4-phosphate dehydrogenase
MTPPAQAILAITMGDPAGTGPEIIAKAAAEGKTAARLVCIGDAASMEKAFHLIKASHRVNPIHTLAEARFQPGTLECMTWQCDHSRW